MMRKLFAATLLATIAAAPAAATSQEGMCDDPPCSKAQIQAYERRVSRHMLRAQQARFEAMSRGEKKRAGRLDKEFRRTQARWIDAKQAMAKADD
jgi:hypothetical protein